MGSNMILLIAESSDQEELLKFDAEGWEFGNFFEITIKIYSNSEMSLQFLKKIAF